MTIIATYTLMIALMCNPINEDDCQKIVLECVNSSINKQKYCTILDEYEFDESETEIPYL